MRLLRLLYGHCFDISLLSVFCGGLGLGLGLEGCGLGLGLGLEGYGLGLGLGVSGLVNITGFFWKLWVALKRTGCLLLGGCLQGGSEKSRF